MDNLFIAIFEAIQWLFCIAFTAVVISFIYVVVSDWRENKKRTRYIMSTTFGIRIPSTGEIEPIARRVGVGNGNVSVYFTNPLAELLVDELEVEAIDNGEQGIFTIGDIKSKIKE